RKHRFHPRPDSPLHLSNEEPVLEYLKFSAKGGVQNPPAPKLTQPARKPKSTKQKALPKPSISTPVASTQPAPTSAPTSAPAKSQENKRKQATETTKKPAKSKRNKHSISRKTRQPKSSPKSVGVSKAEEVPEVTHDLLSLQKHKKTSPADQYIFQRRVSKPTASSRHDESPYALLGQLDNEEESKKVVLGAEEGGQDEGQISLNATITTSTFIYQSRKSVQSSAAPSPSKTAASAEYQAWTTTNIRLRPFISLTPADLEMDEDMAPDEQAQSSDDEDIGSAHILTVNLRQGWWKPFEKEQPTTPEPAWSIRSSDVPRGRPHTKAQCQQITTTVGSTSQVTIQSDFFFNKNLKYLTYGSKGCRPALSISKMKAAYYPYAGLEQMVPDQFWVEEECKYDIAAMYVFSMYGYDYMKKIVLRRADLNEHVIGERDFKQLVIQQRLEDFQLRIESYQTQVNLTKPQWTATGFEYKHDYTVIESPRAVIFRDKYGVQMMMRFNEIHKFNDGTLLQIDEALDYRVKEFRINRLNPGLSTRFWTRKDVDWCNEFMFAIQRHLRTRRIFRNLESFVDGRVREGDYKLSRRTD
nr:hypothetical protein [Tanacetum cinerariifolium]